MRQRHCAAAAAAAARARAFRLDPAKFGSLAWPGPGLGKARPGVGQPGAWSAPQIAYPGLEARRAYPEAALHTVVVYT